MNCFFVTYFLSKRVFILAILLIFYGKISIAQSVSQLDGCDVINNSGTSYASVFNSSTDKYSTGQIMRHVQVGVLNRVSQVFVISPSDVSVNTGSSPTSLTMSWGDAMGYVSGSGDGDGGVLRSDYKNTPLFQNSGCSSYKGPSDLDAMGAWRVPTQRELFLIFILNDKLAHPLSNFSYWSATEHSILSDTPNDLRSWCISWTSGTTSHNANSALLRLRCVKDL